MGSRVPDDGRVLTPEVAVFGDEVAEALVRTLGKDLVGVYFVGSVALGGYVPGERCRRSRRIERRTYRSAEAICGVSSR